MLLFRFWCGVFSVFAVGISGATRPNILVFLIDDMGYSDIAAFGSTNHSTPHMDSLIHSGMKFTQWISAAPICTPSRAALQTGRYPIRTGCMGNVEKDRVIPTPSNPGGLDPSQHTSIATALRSVGYSTGMSGKWHLGINSDKQDRKFTPNAHGYTTYVGAPYTNAPMCAMDSDGVSKKFKTGPTFCFLTANDTVVQSPLKLENFTSAITNHAIGFLDNQEVGAPWFFFMSYFHTHTPLFTNRHNRGRSKGGEFGDNVEELDDSIGEIMAAVEKNGFSNNTVVFLTSDNGPYQEEGWEHSGRTNLLNTKTGLLGRMKGGKGQVYEGGVRMPGAVVWPGVVSPGSVSDVMVSTMDIFPTALQMGGAKLPDDYVVDGKDMTPVLTGGSNKTQHGVFLHYCGFNILAARVDGRYKVFWFTQNWYTFDAKNSSVCLQCCNGINPSSKLTAPASELCDCMPEHSTNHTAQPLVYDIVADPFEAVVLTPDNWPSNSGTSYSAVMLLANKAKTDMEAKVHPSPDKQGAGTCTEGLPAASRQPCCPGCSQKIPFYGQCTKTIFEECTCDSVG